MAKRKITNITPKAARFRFDVLSADIFGGSFNVTHSARAETVRYLHDVN
jgi:hypothetical protein